MCETEEEPDISQPPIPSRTADIRRQEGQASRVDVQVPSSVPVPTTQRVFPGAYRVGFEDEQDVAENGYTITAPPSAQSLVEARVVEEAPDDVSPEEVYRVIRWLRNHLPPEEPIHSPTRRRRILPWLRQAQPEETPPQEVATQEMMVEQGLHEERTLEEVPPEEVPPEEIAPDEARSEEMAQEEKTPVEDSTGPVKPCRNIRWRYVIPLVLFL
jgi:hypothetical protein